MKMMKRLMAFVLLLIMSVTILACGGNGGNSNSGKKQVALMTPYLGSVTTNQMVELMKAALEEEKVEVQVVNTDNDFSELASRIEDVVVAKVDAIVLVSVDPTHVETSLQAAFDADIPVFGCDSGFIEGMYVNATSDNTQMGELITGYLFDDLMDGKGDIIHLTHRPHPGVVKRSEVVDAMLEDYDEISLITEQHIGAEQPIEDARQAVENLLLANPEPGSITAIWCGWDEPAIGAAQAILEAGRDEIIVTGIDGNEQAVELINDGTSLKATVEQNFEGMADIVVQSIMDLFKGNNVEKGEEYAPATLITKK